MKIGTVRVGEAQAYDSHCGWHQFHAEDTQEPHGSFEVFWHGGEASWKSECDFRQSHAYQSECDDDGRRSVYTVRQPGWYWWACFPGCMPDGEPVGPFASSQQAHEDADEWSPDYDEDSS